MARTRPSGYKTRRKKHHDTPLACALIAGASAHATAQSKQFLPLTPMDRVEIQQLIARYAYALDTGGRNGYDYADLFADDEIGRAHV